MLWLEGTDVLKHQLLFVCGASSENESYLPIQDVAGVDLLHSRMFGNKTYIDLEISVDGDKSLWEAHEVAERVHRDVEQRFSDVKYIMIHVNPINITTR